MTFHIPPAHRSQFRITAVIALVAWAALAPVVAAADAVLDWNAHMVSTVAAQNPFAQARFAAITQTAVFEAVNAIGGEYDPYLGTVDAPRWASREAAAVAAAHGVLRSYFPANAGTLDAARATSLASIQEGPAKAAGIAAGEAAAAAMIALRSADGAAPPQFHAPASTDAGEWQTTPGCPPAGGILLHWQNLQPFAIERTDQFRSARPPSLRSFEYARDYKEVRLVGSIDSPFRPQHRTDVARFYNAVLAVGVWNPVAVQISTAQGRSITENARALALMNMAISDALATVMETKYHYRFWRPETAIRAGDADGNPFTVGDPDFVPLITAPCFPSYPSAHASASYAAREVLERVFGHGRHFVTLSTAALPGIVLQYHKLRHITEDIDDARVYGGIHFRFDQEAGARQGERIGAYVHRNTLRRSWPWWHW